MGKILMLLLLIMGLLITGLWGLTALESQRAQRLQAQAALELAQTVQTANLTLLSWFWGGSLALGVGVGIYGYSRWRRGQRNFPIHRQPTGPSFDYETMWWAYRLGQQDTLQALQRGINQPPTERLPALTTHEDSEEQPWELPGSWF